jgi:hypothetical protein
VGTRDACPGEAQFVALVGMSIKSKGDADNAGGKWADHSSKGGTSLVILHPLSNCQFKPSQLAHLPHSKMKCRTCERGKSGLFLGRFSSAGPDRKA